MIIFQKRHPEMPRRPLSSYMLFYLKKKDKIIAKHPGLDAVCHNILPVFIIKCIGKYFQTELSKHISEMYKKLSPEKKEKYNQMALERKKEYEEKLEEFQ